MTGRILSLRRQVTRRERVLRSSIYQKIMSKVLRISDAAKVEDPKDLIWSSILLDLHLISYPLPFLSAKMTSLKAGIQWTKWKKILWASVSTLDSMNSKFCSEADELNDLKKKGMLDSTSNSCCESDRQPICITMLQ